MKIFEWSGWCWSLFKWLSFDFSSSWIPGINLGTTVSWHTHNGGPMHFHFLVDLFVFYIELTIGKDFPENGVDDE